MISTDYAAAYISRMKWDRCNGHLVEEQGPLEGISVVRYCIHCGRREFIGAYDESGAAPNEDLDTPLATDTPIPHPLFLKNVARYSAKANHETIL
jgi:hypothetical protein